MIALLIVIALTLFFLEIFVPGGVLAILGVLFMVIAASMTFADHGIFAAVWVFVGGLLAGVLLFLIELKFLTGTRVGARWFYHSDANTTSSGRSGSEQLTDAEGETLTRMVPGGKVRIAGRIYSAVSIDGYLAKGTPVVVKQADPFTIKVSSRQS